MRSYRKQQKELKQQDKISNKAPLTSLDFLLAVDDFSRIGALRFQDEAGLFQRAPEKGKGSAPPLIELSHLLSASHAVETDTASIADLAYLRSRRCC